MSILNFVDMPDNLSKQILEKVTDAFPERGAPQDETHALNLSEKDVGSIFLDGGDLEWEILDFDPLHDYGFTARAKIARVPTKRDPNNYFYISGCFNKFGKRKHCEGYSDRYSLKSIA